MHYTHFSISGLVLLTAISCMPQQQTNEPPPPPPPQEYQANFSYVIPENAPKTDMTLGLVKPEFGESGQLYKRAYDDNDVVVTMIRKMDSTFMELINAKGFTVRGPWDDVNSITFADKQGSDLVLVPYFDFQVEVKMENTRQVPVEGGQGESKGFSLGSFSTGTSSESSDVAAATETVCDVVVSTSGKVDFKAIEPVTKEQLWFKSVDVDSAKQTFGAQKGDVCTGSAAWSVEVKNAWAKAHEAVYQTSIKAFDTYLTAEELRTYKDTIVDLKNRKRY